MPLPDPPARHALITYSIKDTNAKLSKSDLNQIVTLTDGFSCADVNSFVKETAMIPVRALTTDQLMSLQSQKSVRPITLKDFKTARKTIVPSVSKETIKVFDKWQKEKG
jgi:SpoVK/Ycf46/Vps4 family AAA+-type ATPase